MPNSDLRGKELPRIWTPALRDLTPETSAGFEAIDFAENVLQIELFPWQKWLLIHMLELLPDKTFRFRTFLVLIARQNGKTTLMQVLALWRMFVDGANLVIGTAQNLDVAEEAWDGAVEMAEGVPELAAEIANVNRTNGKKALKLETGERYKVAAASRRGGRGLSGDLILLDELREHQTWDAWGAVTKTTMARKKPQIGGFSNAGDSASIVLAHLREQAIEVIDSGNVDSAIGLFEWSAPDGCAVDDWDALAQANPSLGYTISIASIRSAMETDPDGVFRTEVMCQWVKTLEDLPISVDGWAALTDTESRAKAVTAFAVDVSRDRAWASIAVAGAREDGLLHVECVEHRSDTNWLVARCSELNQTWYPSAFVVDSQGPAASLIGDLEDAGLPVLTTTTTDVANAYASMLDAVKDATLRHRADPDLAMAVLNARKRPIGDGMFAFGRKASGGDITPLVAATLAAWGHNQLGGTGASAFVI